MLERDSLTGLLTEKAFQERARVLIDRGSSAKLDVVARDAERIKIVNETFGTIAGEQLLMSSAGAIEEQEKPLLITRARADTFFMLKERAEDSYERMSNRLAAFLSEYPLPMRLQAKLGVYQIDEKPPDVARICDRALMAAESVKNDYNNDLALYDASMRKQMITEQTIVNTTVESIEREDYYVVLQPKVEVATQRVIGAEALVRWNHPDLGAVSPKDFIPTFEKNGFVHTLDCYVWEKACGMLERWRGTGNAVPLSVNVSRADLYREDLAELLADMVRSHRLEPADLHLEITETVFVEYPASRSPQSTASSGRASSSRWTTSAAVTRRSTPSPTSPSTCSSWIWASFAEPTARNASTHAVDHRPCRPAGHAGDRRRGGNRRAGIAARIHGMPLRARLPVRAAHGRRHFPRAPAAALAA